MSRRIKRHSLQTRITHGLFAISCIWLAISGLFVFIPALAAAVPASLVFFMRMSHRVVGVVFIAVPIISAISAPKGVKHLLQKYTAKWDRDDVNFMKKFAFYMFGAKKVHMPDQHEVKSGQRLADGALILGGILIGISGLFLLLGTTVLELNATFMLVMRLLHDVAFIGLAILAIAHIYMGAGIFQPYRGSHRLMFGDGEVKESDALYHWGHWAREEIESGKNIVYENETPPNSQE